MHETVLALMVLLSSRLAAYLLIECMRIDQQRIVKDIAEHQWKLASEKLFETKACKTEGV